MAVETRQVSGRRTLHFHSYDEMLADVRAMAARPTGNWAIGRWVKCVSIWRRPSMFAGRFAVQGTLDPPAGGAFHQEAISLAADVTGLSPAARFRTIARSDGRGRDCALEKAVERLPQTGERHPQYSAR